MLILRYRWQDREDIQLPVRFDVTPTQFGGERPWFICPLVVREVPCGRRCTKLYLPPGARYFGCRRCHDLTYASSQEAHQCERRYVNESMFGFLLGPHMKRVAPQAVLD